MLKKSLSKKERIILKIYINYILKKKYFKILKKNILHMVYSKSKVVYKNKLILENILDNKYLSNYNKNIINDFNLYSIH